jgi:predicted metalloprotease with PDZ domain
MFHWWNRRTIQFTKDANWIEEGFTTYYAGKALVRSGFGLPPIKGSMSSGCV